MKRYIILTALILSGCWGNDCDRIAATDSTDAGYPVVDSGPMGTLWHCGCPAACHTDTSQPIQYCADRMAMEWTVTDIVQQQCIDFHGVDGQCRCGPAVQICDRW